VVHRTSLRRWGVRALGVMLCVSAAAGPLLAPSADAASSEADPSATAARTIMLTESGHLRPVTRGGNTIAEEGEATGTYRCSIVVHLQIVATNRVTATFTVRPQGGTVTGKGSARLVTSGGYGYFGGTLAITKGTGAFAHASGNNIGISGKFNRETLHVTVNVHGTVRV
jgi:hypothetical protein